MPCAPLVEFGMNIKICNFHKKKLHVEKLCLSTRVISVWILVDSRIHKKTVASVIFLLKINEQICITTSLRKFSNCPLKFMFYVNRIGSMYFSIVAN